MKTYTLILAILLSGCKDSISNKQSYFKIVRCYLTDDIGKHELGLYKYDVIGTNSAVDFMYYSDSIYTAGDTLKLVKQ